MNLLFALLLLLPLFVSQTNACLATSPVEMPRVMNCLTCDANLFPITTAGAGVQPIEDKIDRTTSPCAFRIITCQGPDPRISINNGFIILPDNWDGKVDGKTAFSSHCSDGGTEWLTTFSPNMPRFKITKVECFGS